MVQSHPLGLNPEPTDIQLYLFRLHKKNGTSPGNPKWYRNPGAKFRRRRTVGGPPRFPKYETGTESRHRSNLLNSNLAPDPFLAAVGRSLLNYIKAFDKARGLIPLTYW
jgi:hypothetical protein